MKKNWKTALVILIALGATFTVVQFGVKKAVKSSLDQTKTSPSQPNDSTQAVDANGNVVDAQKNAANGVNGQSTEGSSSVSTTGAEKIGADGKPIQGSKSEGSASTSTTGAASHDSKPTQVAGEVKKVAPPAPENNCFSFEYRHTKEAQNKDIEDFLDYSNAFAVGHKNVNEKSVCVKVNNKPVAFKMNKNKGQDEVMIGAVVGPESVIKVSYCIGKVTCKEACAVKSNRFMDDMMSDAGDEDEFKDSWGENNAAHTAQKKELQGKVKELRSVASENKDLAQRSVIRTWDQLQHNEWVCKK